MDIGVLKKYEEDVEKFLNKMTHGHKLIMYKTLYNQGLRIDKLEENLRKIKKYEELYVDPTENTQDAPLWQYGVV